MQQELNPNSKAPIKGVALLFGSVLVAGILIGGVTSLISNFIYLIILFPLLMGLAMRVIIKSAVVSEKIRSPFLVIFAGIFGTLIIYGSLHFFDYLQFRNQMTKDIQAQVIAEYGEAAPKENVQAYIDYLFVEETGVPGFIGFILLQAKEGVSISNVGPGSSGSEQNLGAFTWVLWLVEMGFIFWGSTESAYKKAKDLFCERCNAWIPEGDHIGGVQKESINQVIDLVRRRDFVHMLELLQKDTVFPSLEFYTRTCKTCNASLLYLTGSVISSAGQGQAQNKLVIVQALNSSERFALLSELERLSARQ